MLNNTLKVQTLAPYIAEYHFLEGSSYDNQTMKHVENILNQRKFDFLFIDGDHSYHGVVEDFLCYYNQVKDGGYIGFHDIVADEVVKKGVKPEESGFYGGDVYQVWSLIKPLFKHHEFVETWDQYGYGIGVIQKSPQVTLQLLTSILKEALPVAKAG